MTRRVFSCAALAAPLARSAPDAAQLLAAARKALGKTELKSLTATGTHRINLTAPGSTETRVSNRELTLSVLFPSRFLKEETMDGPMGGAGPVVVEGFDGEKAWNDTRQTGGGMFVMRMGGPNMTEEAKTRRMHEMFARYLMAMTLATQADYPLQFSYAGEAEAPDGKADVLDAKGPDNFAMRVFLDSSTHMPLMLTYQAPEQRIVMNRMMRGPGHAPPDAEKMKADLADQPKPPIVEHQVRPSEFRKVSGLLLPHAITWTVAGKVMEEIVVKKYVVNPALSPDIFRKK